MPPRHLITGQGGEHAAAAFLKKSGLRILQRNWRQGRMELDLVCADPATEPETLVFVEVRTRKQGGRATPAQTVGKSKRQSLSRAASLYLSAYGLWERPCRFDLVSVTASENGFSVEHVPNAFDASGSLGGGNTAWQPW